MQTSRAILVGAAIAILTLGGGAAFAQDGTVGSSNSDSVVGTLANSYSTVVNGDFVAAGVGLRGTGTGMINVSGIPAGATVQSAFLYWVTIGTSNTFTNPTLDGMPVNGALIGSGGDTCWGASGNFGYRADVSSMVSGNGTYTIAGLPNSGPGVDDSQGASLVVVYSDPTAPARAILINDGIVTLDSNGDVYTDTLTGFVPDSPLTGAHVTYLMGDGQNFGSPMTFNSQTVTMSFPGADGPLWDTLDFDVTATNPTDPVDSTLTITGDCLAWAATVFAVTTDSAPVPATPTWALVAILVVLGAGALYLIGNRHRSAR